MSTRQSYSKPPSLWQLVEEIVPPHEHSEIKEMLGNSLIEQSLELHQEIDTLLEIWQQVRDERAEITVSPKFLPEPPNQRDHLIKEICFFVENVKEKAQQKGVNPDVILKKHNSVVLNYANEITRPGSSLSSLSSLSNGRETPLIPVVKERYHTSEVKGELKAKNEHLNYLDFDKVCDSLRSTLVKEINQLLEDAQFLQNCLDNEVDIRDCVTPGPSREPTLAELREERSLLEKELLATTSLTATPVVNKPKFRTNRILPQTPPSSNETSPSVTPNFFSEDSILISENVSKDPPPSFKSRPRPMKASHCISLSSTSSTKLTSDKIKTAASKTTLSKPAMQMNCLSPDKHEVKTSKSDGQLNPQRPSEQKTLPAHQNLVLKSDKQVGLAPNLRAKRRSVSTGRLRVVDVTSIVEAQSGRGDATAISDDYFTISSSASSTSPFSPSPPSYTSDPDSMLRPGSSHANRFRKMVLGCRDGE